MEAHGACGFDYVEVSSKFSFMPDKAFYASSQFKQLNPFKSRFVLVWKFCFEQIIQTIVVIVCLLINIWIIVISFSSEERN